MLPTFYFLRSSWRGVDMRTGVTRYSNKRGLTAFMDILFGWWVQLIYWFFRDKTAMAHGTRTQRGLAPAPPGPLRSEVWCIAAHNPEYVRQTSFCLVPLPLLSFHAPQRRIKSLVRLAVTHILNNGGVVRGIQYWGSETLPQRMRSHGINRQIKRASRKGAGWISGLLRA